MIIIKGGHPAQSDEPLHNIMYSEPRLFVNTKHNHCYSELLTLKAMFNFWSTAVGMHNFGVMTRHTVVVLVELPRQLRLVLHPVVGEVLEAGLEVELTRQMIEQGGRLPPQHREPVLIPESDLHAVFCDEGGHLTTTR